MLIAFIFLLVCAALGLAYGGRIMLTKKTPAYFSLVLFSMAGQVFARIFYIVSLVCYGGLPDIFNIGYIGFASFFLFLFFANYGQIDTLVDDGRNLHARYRIIPVIVPAAELVAALILFFTEKAGISVRISFVILSVLAGLAGYLNVKHLIAPDVEGGIVRSIRGFNLAALITEILTLAEIGLICFCKTDAVYAVQIALGVLLVLLMPLLNREVQKWT